MLENALQSVIGLTAQRDSDALHRMLLESVGALFPVRAAALYGYVPGGSAQLVEQWRGHHGPQAPGFTPVEPDVLAHLSGPHAHILACGTERHFLPITLNSQRHAVLAADSIRPLMAELDTLRSLVHVYENCLAILTQGERDQLTGLLNRRTFDQKLARLLAARAVPVPHERRQPGDAWLAVVDVDHFKSVNDTYGHVIGDEVLLLLSQHMQGHFRHSDLLFRFGGEEFVVVLDPTSNTSAHAVLDAFRDGLSQQAFPQVGHITVSVGFAKLGPHDYPATVVDRADQALYYAKQNGRNQVRSYEDLISAGLLDSAAAAGDIDLF